MKGLPDRKMTTRSGVTLSMSPVGLGTAPLGNMFQAQSETEAAATFAAAFDLGVSYFDTAPLYGLGLAERRLGMAIRDLDRQNITVSTKVGRLLRRCSAEFRSGQGQWVDVPSREIEFDYSYDGFMRSYEASLERMGLDRVEILFCHDIDVHTHGSEQARDRWVGQFLGAAGGYKALEELRSTGDVDAIGIGVNEWEICDRMAQETDVDLFLLAGRFTLLEQEALETFLPRCLQRDMRVVVGGPFNSGILATGPIDGAHFNYAPAPPEIKAQVRKIEEICAGHGFGLAEAAVQFPLVHPAVISVIPGGATEDQVRANRAAFDRPPPMALWHDLQTSGLLHASLDFGVCA